MKTFHTFTRWLPVLVAALVAFLIGREAVAGPPAWELSAAQSAAVRAGEVVVVATRGPDGAQRDGAAVQAAVEVPAPVATLFRIMTDCAAAPSWVPHLVRCTVLERDPAGQWELISHEVDYGWFAPKIFYVFRATYTDNSTIRFAHVSGDFEKNDGVWSLTPVADGAATLVTYRVQSRPRLYVPTWLYERSIRAELPALLRALRARAAG